MTYRSAESRRRPGWVGRLGLGLPVLVFLAWLPALGAVYYVDGNCPSSGTGSTTVCGANGPKKTIPQGIALLASPGDTLRIRGAHTRHDTEIGDFDGRYESRAFVAGNDIDGKAGASGNPIVVEAYGWTAVGAKTQESVYIEGTGPPGTGSTLGWTQCSTCSSGTCVGVTGVCNEVWYTKPATSGMSLASGAQRPDGKPTRRVLSLAALTNQFDSYVPASTSGATLFVRWGTGVNAPVGSNNPKPHVFYDNANGFLVRGGSRWITIRGFNFRDFEDAGIQISGTNTANIVVQDNVIGYMSGNPSGGDYGVASFFDTNITIDSNEILYTGSEAIHVEPLNDVATVVNITKNYIHNIGDQAVLGTAVSGTPNGMTLGCSPNNSGNYAGSLVDGNLIVDIKGPTARPGWGISLENHGDNWVIRNNIVLNPAAACLEAFANSSTQGVSMNGNQIYNNLFVGCGVGNGGQGALIFVGGTGKEIKNNLVYDNTIVSPVGFPAMVGFCNGGACSGNVFRNNIVYDDGSKMLVDWQTTDPTDIFTNNLVYSKLLASSNTLVRWGGTGYTCGSIQNIAASNKCDDPKFSPTANDFHLLPGSPAINAGTSLGMPAQRTASIDNRLASAHGLPSYADAFPMSGPLWDMGAMEFGGGLPAPAANLTLSDPSPTAAGNVTVTLVTTVPVVQVPGPLTFNESDGSSINITLSGAVTGSVFTGIFTVGSNVADGDGTFVLPAGSLVDALGNTGNAIISGAVTKIDKTAPLSPQNLRLSAN